ncbi:alpha-amylase [Photobacterium aquae]|uniref:Alpha-amylase n=1 Tax=Photobacterium aquae TaxID=1195763 RepID=A0A0J1H5J8_9GAMM|nr:alpha-amylase family glycosyl hydrolase [Photobacterium aquae]KLV07010.1 alpha-amylase [Photobacterium aquae]
MTNHQSPATNVILHAFDWPYGDIAKHAAAIARAGFKAVLVSPPMKSHKSDRGTPWWQRYQPQDYRVIDNQLGNTDDFKAMIQSLNQNGLHTYADVVFNHMANESSIRDDLSYPSSATIAEYQTQADYVEKIKLYGDLSQPIFTKSDFVTAFPIKNWRSPWEVQHGRISGGNTDPGLPTLRTNDNVVKQQQNYLNALMQLGIKGVRIDAAKHLTIDHINRLWGNQIPDGLHIFGEIITDGGASKEEYNLFLAPYLQHTPLGAYDFPLFHTIYNVLENKAPMADLSNPYSVGEALAYDRAITFAITHDIPNNAVFLEQVMSETNEYLAYSYILGRDGGVPLIYSDLNTSNIVNSQGNPRWQNSWQNPALQGMIAFHNRMHGLPMAIMEVGINHLVFSRGDEGIVAINRGDIALKITLPEGQYYEFISGTPLMVTNTTSSVVLAAKQAMMLCRSPHH